MAEHLHAVSVLKIVPSTSPLLAFPPSNGKSCSSVLYAVKMCKAASQVVFGSDVLWCDVTT